MTNPRFAILYKVNEYESEDVMGNTRVPECDLRDERPVCRLYLPFASGNDIKLGTRPGGMAAFPAFVGFGVSDISINYFGEQINLDDEFANFAITLPETFAIDALAATFYNIQTGVYGNSVITVKAQLYHADNSTNIFKPIKETLLALKPDFYGNTGDIKIACAVKKGINLKINAGSRLLLVFYSEANGGRGITEIRGYASAGLTLT